MSAFACRVNAYARTRELISAGAHAYTPSNPVLTHWGWVAHICVSKLTIIGPDNGLSPGWHQAIIRANAGIFLLFEPQRQIQWNLQRNSYIFIQENVFEIVVWKSSGQFVSTSMGWVKIISDIHEYAHPINNTRDCVLSALCIHTGCFCLKGVVYEFCK